MNVATSTGDEKTPPTTDHGQNSLLCNMSVCRKGPQKSQGEKFHGQVESRAFREFDQYSLHRDNEIWKSRVSTEGRNKQQKAASAFTWLVALAVEEKLSDSFLHR